MLSGPSGRERQVHDPAHPIGCAQREIDRKGVHGDCMNTAELNHPDHARHSEKVGSRIPRIFALGAALGIACAAVVASAASAVAAPTAPHTATATTTASSHGGYGDDDGDDCDGLLVLICHG